MNTQNREITLTIDDELYQQLETFAAKKDISVQEYVKKALERAISEEPRPISRETYENILRLREEIKKNHPGVVFEDSTEIIRQMREERSRYLADL